MSFLFLILFCISSIGYFRAFRAVFRLHFTSAVFVSTCAMVLTLMISGIFSVILPATYILTAGGLLLVLKDAFLWENRQLHLKAHWLACLKKNYCTMEYFFWAALVILFYFLFSLFRGDLGYPDIYTAWYNQFYYLVQHDKWSDRGYINYASSYAMGGNAFAYYLTTLLRNYSTQIYIYAYSILFINFMMPVFRLLNWRKVPLWSVLWVLPFLLLFRNFLLIPVWVIWGAASALWVYKYFRSKNRPEDLKNPILILLGTFMLALFMLYYFAEYPMDAVMGALICGIFLSCIIDVFLFYKESSLYLTALPLAVLPLIKPTGMIPAILLAVGVGIFMFWRTLKHKCPQQRSRRQKILHGAAIFLVIAAPLVSYKAWGWYAKISNFTFQHSVSSGEIVSGTFRQIKNGVTGEEKSAYRSRMEQMLYYDGHYRIVTKSLPEKVIDYGVAAVMSAGNLDFEQNLSGGRILHNRSHVYSVTILLIIFFAAGCFMLKRHRKIFIAAGAGSLIFFLIIAFLQCYIVPMFTTIPGLFRYLWPGLVPLWVVVMLVLMFDIKDNFRKGVILLLLFLYTFFPLFIWRKMVDHSGESSSLGWVMLARERADQVDNVVFSSTSRDFRVNTFLEERLDFPVKKNIYKDFKSIPPEKLSGVTLLAVGNDKFMTGYRKLPDNLPRGLYLVRLAPDLRILSCVPLFTDQAMVDKLNKKYKFADPDSFRSGASAGEGRKR